MKKYNFLEEYTFKNGAKIKNRIVMAPMTTMASFHDGRITKDELEYYAARTGGVGMLITGVVNVSENGKGFEGELSITNDFMIPGLTKLATTIKNGGTKAILQIFHAGRKSDSKILRGEQPVSASAVKAVYPPDLEVPRALEEHEIEKIIKEFGEATRRAIIAGFDGIELHGANTYLLQQFFSPHSNRREDKWGGSLENRMRFAEEIIKVVKEQIEKYAKKEFILGYRISPEEVETPGIRLEDSLYFAEKIKDKVDYIHLSMGSYKRTSLNNKESKKTLVSEFAKKVDNTIPIIAVGSIETPEDAEAALKEGATFAAMGRELIREPKWVQKVMAGDEKSIRREISASDMEELAIPGGMQSYLEGFYRELMKFTTANNENIDFHNTMAPMEGSKKSL